MVHMAGTARILLISDFLPSLFWGTEVDPVKMLTFPNCHSARCPHIIQIWSVWYSRKSARNSWEMFCFHRQVCFLFLSSFFFFLLKNAGERLKKSRHLAISCGDKNNNHGTFMKCSQPPTDMQGRHHKSIPAVSPNEPRRVLFRISFNPELQAAITNRSKLVFVWNQLVVISDLTQTFPWLVILNKMSLERKKESFWNNELMSLLELEAGSLTPESLMQKEDYEVGKNYEFLFLSWLYYFLSVWHWKCHFPSLSFSFLNCDIEINLRTSQGGYEV